MNYIIFDLEFNQKHPDNKDIASPNLTFEILQIGAIKFNSSLKYMDNFNRLVRPTVYPSIHPYVEKLTDITLDKVMCCDTFPIIIKDFIDFINDKNSVFVVWGTEDMRELYRNLSFFNLDISKLDFKYIDLQQYAGKHFNIKKGCKIGLKDAIDKLNLSSDVKFHDAYNDAYYTSEIFKILFNTQMKPKSYSLPREKVKAGPKEKVDMNALFNQFNKIYKREMTAEEKEIIKLAYIMGKTRQFIHE